MELNFLCTRRQKFRIFYMLKIESVVSKVFFFVFYRFQMVVSSVPTLHIVLICVDVVISMHVIAVCSAPVVVRVSMMPHGQKISSNVHTRIKQIFLCLYPWMPLSYIQMEITWSIFHNNIFWEDKGKQNLCINLLNILYFCI